MLYTCIKSFIHVIMIIIIIHYFWILIPKISTVVNNRDVHFCRLSEPSKSLSTAKTEVLIDLETVRRRVPSVTGTPKEEGKSAKSKKVLCNGRMSFTNRFPSSQHTRYRSSWGPSSVSVFNRIDVPRPSPEEEEYADFYHERLHSAQSRQLIPLQEDLADWINKTISKFV